MAGAAVLYRTFLKEAKGFASVNVRSVFCAVCHPYPPARTGTDICINARMSHPERVQPRQSVSPFGSSFMCSTQGQPRVHGTSLVSMRPC